MSSRGFTITQAIRQERRKRAEERQAEYDKLSLQEKLDRLPPEPGAKKQRARLLKAIEDAKKPQPKVETKTPAAQSSAEQAPKQTQKKYMKGSSK